MGFLDRLRGGGSPAAAGRRGGDAETNSGVGAGSSSGAGGTGSDTGPGAAVAVTAGWAGLAPMQRAAVRQPGVADAGFGGRLSTWQNPSFTGTLSHAVLDGAPGGLVKDVLTTSAKPVPGLELPSHTLPVAVDEPEVPDAELGAALPVQRAPGDVTASRPEGPRVTPVAPRSDRPTLLTGARTTPVVQRRALPLARRERAGSGGPAARATPGAPPSAAATVGPASAADPVGATPAVAAAGVVAPGADAGGVSVGTAPSASGSRSAESRHAVADSEAAVNGPALPAVGPGRSPGGPSGAEIEVQRATAEPHGTATTRAVAVGDSPGGGMQGKGSTADSSSGASADVRRPTAGRSGSASEVTGTTAGGHARTTTTAGAHARTTAPSTPAGATGDAVAHLQRAEIPPSTSTSTTPTGTTADPSGTATTPSGPAVDARGTTAATHGPSPAPGSGSTSTGPGDSVIDVQRVAATDAPAATVGAETEKGPAARSTEPGGTRNGASGTTATTDPLGDAPPPAGTTAEPTPSAAGAPVRPAADRGVEASHPGAAANFAVPSVGSARTTAPTAPSDGGFSATTPNAITAAVTDTHGPAAGFPRTETSSDTPAVPAPFTAISAPNSPDSAPSRDASAVPSPPPVQSPPPVTGAPPVQRSISDKVRPTGLGAPTSRNAPATGTPAVRPASATPPLSSATPTPVNPPAQPISSATPSSPAERSDSAVPETPTPRPAPATSGPPPAPVQRATTATPSGGPFSAHLFPPCPRTRSPLRGVRRPARGASQGRLPCSPFSPYSERRPYPRGRPRRIVRPRHRRRPCASRRPGPGHRPSHQPPL